MANGCECFCHGKTGGYSHPHETCVCKGGTGFKNHHVKRPPQASPVGNPNSEPDYSDAEYELQRRYGI